MTEHVTVEPAKHIKITREGKVVAESSRGFVCHEVGLSDRYYVPREDVRATLAEGNGKGVCPWKGLWHHVDVTVDGEHVANGAWSYHETKPATDPMKDFVAFYDTKFHIEATV